MITSPKAKAIVAAIITGALSIAGIVVQQLNAGSWTSQSTIALVTGILVTLGTTFGVYTQTNAPVPKTP